MYNQRILDALDRFPEIVPEELPESLPLLDDYRHRHPRRQSEGDLTVLLIQHHLGPFIRRLDAMFDDGVRPDRTWFVDIPYSTNEEVREEIPKRFGISPFHISPPLRDPLAPYATLQLQRVANLIQHLAQGNVGSRLLVIDDGAYFVRALKDLEDLGAGLSRAFAGRTFIVEQTTRGHRYYEEEDLAAYRHFVEGVLDAPVVSIAKSTTKTEFESPFIGAAAARGLQQKLKTEGLNLDQLGRVALIRFGPVGEAVFKALNPMGHEGPIEVIEIDEGKHTAIRDLGGVPRAALPDTGSFDLLIGCTGYASFGLRHWDVLADDACLVSTSSAAVEFNRKQFIDLADLYPDDEFEVADREATRKQGIHATVRIVDSQRKRQVRFMNASFPVNFDGRLECLPARMIQATHTLLYAASRQVLQSSRPGLQVLNKGLDQEIYEGALRYL